MGCRGPTLQGRTGGDTRIIKLAAGAGDNDDLSLIEFVENISLVAAKKKLAQKPQVKAKKETGKKDDNKEAIRAKATSTKGKDTKPAKTK